MNQKDLGAFEADSQHPVYQVANDFEREKGRQPHLKLPDIPIHEFHPQEIDEGEIIDEDSSMVPKAIKQILAMYGFDSS